MAIFTVIGVYADNRQRFAQDYEADSPEAAERSALDYAVGQGTELIVAGVVAGRVDVVA